MKGDEGVYLNPKAQTPNLILTKSERPRKTHEGQDSYSILWLEEILRHPKSPRSWGQYWALWGLGDQDL